MTARHGSAQIVAIDLGGTSVRSARVSADGLVESTVKEPVQHGAVPQQLARLIRAAAADGDITRAVLGVPGRVNRRAGRVERARNLPQTDLAALSARDLSAATGLEVELAGDAELACAGEVYFGAGRRHGTVGYLTISTGLGAAVISEGRVLAGYVAGFQIGFLPDPAGSGRMLDEVASGQRIHRYARELGLDTLSVQELLQRVDAGDAAARLAFDEIADAAAAAAIILAHTVSPDLLVIGGGVALGAGEKLLERVRRRLDDTTTSHVSMPCEVVPAILGDEAALAGVGAWSLARPDGLPADKDDASQPTREGTTS